MQNSDFATDAEINYSSDTYYAIKHINKHFSEAISVAEMAKNAHVSVNTLERHFMQTLNISPTEYIKRKRLANATKLLSMGYTVNEASFQSGFSDCSSFIALFKKIYGITPLKYKKRTAHNRSEYD